MTATHAPRWARLLPTLHPYAFVTGALGLAMCLDASLRLLWDLSAQTGAVLALTLVRIGLGLVVLVWVTILAERFPRWAGCGAAIATGAILVVRLAVAPEGTMTLAALHEFPFVAFYLMWFYRHGVARAVIYPVMALAVVVSLVAGLRLDTPTIEAQNLVTFLVSTLCAAGIGRFMVGHHRRRVDVDPLTGTQNRAGLQRAGRILLSESPRGSGELCVAVVDADRLKAINDAEGHPAGDRALRRLADHLSSSTRDSDVVGRPGGDEFVIILPGVGGSDAARILARVRRDSPVPFSWGTAQRRAEESLDELVARADGRMYRQKRRRAAGGVRSGVEPAEDPDAAVMG